VLNPLRLERRCKAIAMAEAGASASRGTPRTDLRGASVGHLSHGPKAAVQGHGLNLESKGRDMSLTTILILVVVFLVLFGGGGGYYWSRRRL
jgi:hypothetical protein